MTNDWGELADLSSGSLFSSRALREAVDRRAAELSKKGLRPGGRHIVANHNTSDTLIDTLAAWQIEACVVPIDAQDPRAVALTMRLSGAKPWPPDIALALLTSGSAGIPKLTLHRRTAIKQKFADLGSAIPGSDCEVTLCALPTNFGHGLVCNSLFPLLSGRRLVLAKSFSPDLCSRLDEIVHNHGVTFLSSTPAIWNLIEAFGKPGAKPSLKRVHCASAPLDSRRANLMRNWAGPASLWNVYGMTEFLGWIAGHRLLESHDAPRVGTGWGAQFRIDLPSSETWARGETLMAGWASVTEPDQVTWLAKEDWWPTRDLGKMDEFGLTLIGRMDLVINKGGLKIQPEEVEIEASANKMVRACVCMGAPDPLWGQKILLFVEPSEPSIFSENALRSWLASRLVPYKVPDLIRVVETLPINARGKVDREKLRMQL